MVDRLGFFRLNILLFQRKMQITKFRENRHLAHHFVKQVRKPRVQKQIILPCFEHSDSFVQCLNVHWADLGECCVRFWVQNN